MSDTENPQPKPKTHLVMHHPDSTVVYDYGPGTPMEISMQGIPRRVFDAMPGKLINVPADKTGPAFQSKSALVDGAISISFLCFEPPTSPAFVIGVQESQA